MDTVGVIAERYIVAKAQRKKPKSKAERLLPIDIKGKGENKS